MFDDTIFLRKYAAAEIKKDIQSGEQETMMSSGGLSVEGVVMLPPVLVSLQTLLLVNI